MIPVVIYGQTGCGKTNLLRELQHSKRGVIDLEKLTGHRGSAFGQINITESQLPQTTIEESIRKKLDDLQGEDFVFLEHKPLNIGKFRLPDTVIHLYATGIAVLLQSTFERRVENILGEYLPADHAQLMLSLEKLKERLTPAYYAALKKLLAERQYPAFTAELLRYYDQSKQYNPHMEYAYTIYDRGSAANAGELLHWLRHHVVASDRTTGSTLS